MAPRERALRESRPQRAGGGCETGMRLAAQVAQVGAGLRHKWEAALGNGEGGCKTHGTLAARRGRRRCLSFLVPPLNACLWAALPEGAKRLTCVAGMAPL